MMRETAMSDYSLAEIKSGVYKAGQDEWLIAEVERREADNDLFREGNRVLTARVEQLESELCRIDAEGRELGT